MTSPRRHQDPLHILVDEPTVVTRYVRFRMVAESSKQITLLASCMQSTHSQSRHFPSLLNTLDQEQSTVSYHFSVCVYVDHVATCVVSVGYVFATMSLRGTFLLANTRVSAISIRAYLCKGVTKVLGSDPSIRISDTRLSGFSTCNTAHSEQLGSDSVKS